MLKIYGLSNCDKTQALQKQLKANNTNYTFIDFKIKPPSKDQITSWCKQKSWSLLLNKRSTTWKALSGNTQESINTQAKAIELLFQYPTLIKRPIVEDNGKLV